MKKLTLHFLPALAGDCFVLEFANKDCIIIDCGYRSTYKNQLKPLLLQLKTKGCKVILLLITHTDRDHLEGAIELVKENGNSKYPKIISIENIWYNGIYNTLKFNLELQKRIMTIPTEQEQKTGMYLAQLLSQLPGISDQISATNCISFEQVCLQNGYKLNSHFTNKIVKRCYDTYEEKRNHYYQIGDCKIAILSPADNEIIKLSKALHIDMLRTLGKDYAISNDSKFIKLCELIMETKTNSVDVEENISASSEKLESWIGTSKMTPMNEINQASIVVEIQYGDLIMLFTGDSESSLWCDFLQKQYDIIKLSHHGTAKPNMKLLEQVQGKRLLISTNGSANNRHPEKETIARAILSKNKELYFNYSHPFKQILEDIQEQYGFQAFFEQNIIEL